MPWWGFLLLIVGSLLLLFATGFPVAFCFLIISGIGAIYFYGGPSGFEQLALNAYSTLSNFIFVSVPLFVLMGLILFHSGLAAVAIGIMDKSLGRIPGRLSILAVAAGAVFGLLSGAATASTAMLTSTLFPEMQKRNYAHEMSIGAILAGGILDPLIPPSVVIIILGSVSGIPVGKLLIASLIPGFILAFIFLAYILLRCWRNPLLAPAYESVTPLPPSQTILLYLKYVVPLGLIFFAAMGLIFLGVCTPSEAAAFGALTAFLLAAMYGKLSLKAVRQSFTETVKVTIMLFMIVAGSVTYSQIMAISGASAGMVQAVVGLKLAPIFIVIGMQIVFLVLGTFMDQTSMIMVCIPLFMPVVKALGLDQVWFGMVSLVSMVLGALTPPFGLCLFIVKGFTPPEVTMGHIYKSVMPYIYVSLIALALFIAFPPLSTWLPSLMK